MRILVIGGTGTVGRAVVAKLLARGVSPYVLARSVDKITALPHGAIGILGDLLDPPSVSVAMDACDAVFMVNALSPSETQEGITAVSCAARLGVGRFVYLSAFNLERSKMIPHFGSKGAIETALRLAIQHHQMRFVVLRPNHFFQNDLLSKNALLRQGDYAEPLGEAGVSRIDVRDIADAAANALLAQGSSDFDGGTHELSGPQALRACDVAACWAKALGKPVHENSDLEAWQQRMGRFLPSWQLFNLRCMYESYHRGEAIASPQSLQQQQILLGHAPRRYTDFVDETATQWLAR